MATKNKERSAAGKLADAIALEYSQKNNSAPYKPVSDLEAANQMYRDAYSNANNPAKIDLTKYEKGNYYSDPTIEALNNAAKSVYSGYADTNVLYGDMPSPTYKMPESVTKAVRALQNGGLNQPSNYIQGIANQELAENIARNEAKQKELQDFRKTVESYVDNSNFSEMSGYDLDRATQTYKANTPRNFEDWLLNAGSGKYGSQDYLEKYTTINNREGLQATNYSNLTEKEKSIYNYLFNIGRYSDAEKYLESLESELNARTRAKDEETLSAFADEHPVIASAASVPMSIPKAAGTVANAINYARTGELDPNASYNWGSYGSQAIRDTVSEDMGNVGKFLYGTGMSMADNLFNMAIAGGFNSAFAEGANVWEKVRSAMSMGEPIVLSLMGTAAANDSIIQAKDKGYSDEKAIGLGLLSGAIEIITERIGMDALFNFKQMDENAIKYILQSTFAEGGEEGLADIMNWFAEDLYALLHEGDTTEWQNMIQEYMAQGFSESEAVAKAFTSRLMELGQDIAGGALSGGIMSGGGVAINRTNQYVNARAIANDLEQGINSTNEDEKIESSLEKEYLLDLAKSKGSEKLQEQVIKAEENGEVSKKDTVKILYELQKDMEYNAMKTQTVAEGVESVLGIENKNFANEIVKQYDTNQNATDFIKDAKAIQNAVANNLELNEVELSTMNLAQAEAVYNTIKVGEEDGNQLHGSSKWDDSKSARGQNGSLAEKSGEIKAEYQIDSRAKDSHVKSVTLAQEVIQESRQLTLKNGKTITTAPVREVVGNFTAPMKRAVSRAEKAGYKVRFFVGDYLIETDQTGEGRRRATINENTKEIWLKADDSQFASDQVVIHELTHPKLWVDEKAGIPSKFREDLKSKLQESLGEKLYDQLLLSYLQANANADLTSIDQFKSSDIQYWEDELLCDMNAGMNVFNGTSFTATARLVESKLGSIRAAVNSVEDNKAPPTTSVGTKFSSKSSATYTEQQYNDYGWVRANNVLTSKEYVYWNNVLYDMKNYNRAADGTYIIPVSEKQGIGNVLVFTAGSLDNPIIDRVIRINFDIYQDYDVETDLDIIRSYIYEEETKSDSSTVSVVNVLYNGELLNEFTIDNSKVYTEEQKSRARSKGNQGTDDVKNGTRSNPVVDSKTAKQIARLETSYDKQLDTRIPNRELLQRYVNEKAELLGYVREGNYFVKDGIYKDAYEYTFDNDGEVIPLSERFNANNRDVRYSTPVTDSETLKFLDSQDYVVTYKTMRKVGEGQYVSPMATKINGKYEMIYKIDEWAETAEHPELVSVKLTKQQREEYTRNHPEIKAKGKYAIAEYVLAKDFEEYVKADGSNLYFRLNKGDGNSIYARYNPYEHSSNLMFNDQFKSAYNQDDFVTIEMAIPKSELSSKYRAKYAKDTTGFTAWKSGEVSAALAKSGAEERGLYLSRWAKPVREIPNSEVAAEYGKALEGTGIKVKWNVVNADLLNELEKLGVPIDYSPMATSAGEIKYEDVYGNKKYSSVLDNQVSLDDLLLELAQTNKTKAENFAARLTDAGEQIGMNLVFIPTSELSVGDTETVAVTSKPETKVEVKSETKTETKTPAKKKTVTKTSKTDNKINDFGNKIGGARKDLWREKGLGIQDLAGMNEAEKGKFITKDNIWNKVDYQALVDSGIARDVVYFRKQLRDALPTSPYIKYNATEEEKQTARENYIEFITSVRSAVENIKTKEDAEAFFENYFVKSGLYDRRSRRVSNDQVTSKFFNTSQNARNWKWNIVAPMAKAQFLVPKEQKLPKGIEIIYEEGGIGTSLKPGTYFVVKDSHFIIATDFESREAAYKWVQDTMGTKETSDRKKKFVPPQLTDIHRVGRDVRNNNRKNITGQDYLDTFGFYGGEFGNWLNESDRQFSLNYGYDALIDLADALGISEKDISLGGKLSIAFGSRGVKGAAAHFEPLRKVINLTKMNGAGSLAHEWGHALDNIIADELGLKKYMTEESYKLPGRLKTVVNKLLDDMMYKQVEMTNEDVIAEKQKELKKYQANVRGWINRSFTQLTVDKMTDVNKRLLNQYIEEALNPTEKYWGLLAGGDATEGVVGKLNMLLKSNTGRVIPKDERHQLSLNIGRVFDLNEDIKNPETQSRRVRTDYYNQSQIMGQYHAKDGGYWTSEIEMFARAFACYVTDKLEGRQQKSDYLSAHSDAAIIIVPDKNGNPQVVKAFPVGEERLQINNDIDEFISTLIDLGYLHKGSQVVEDVVDQETGEILGEKGTYSVSRYSTVYDFDNNPTPLNRTIDSNGTELSEEQNNFFANSVVRDDAGRLMRMYHGTQRGDRVGYVFDPAKATSGSMAYFTNNRSIADNYAKNKSDTSLSRDYESYYDMFTVDGKNLTDLWKSLPYSKRAAIKAEMYNIGLDDDYENWVHEKNANANSFSRGTFDDYLRHNDNNPLYAMYRMLEDNGLPYESFTDILEFAGIEGDIAYDNPDIRNEKTYEVYLNITNPLDTSDIPESVVKDLAKETKKAQKTFKPGGNRFGDTYDKFSIPPEVWYDRLLDDIKNGTTHTWTTVPDYVTEYLKKKGYDGIKDLGGKNGGQVHEVYIPFTSNQVKEVTNLNPTSSNDIRYSSVLDSEGNKLSKTQAEYFKDSVIRDENGNLKVMYHGTHKAGFTVFDPKHSDDKISLFFTDSKENAMTYDSQGEMEFPTKEKTFENIQAEIEGITGGDWTLEERDGQYAIIDNTILDYDFDLDENGDIDFTGEKASADPDYNVVKTFDTVEEAYYGFLDEQPFKMWWLGEDVNLVYPVYLNVTNPLVVEANGNQWNEIPVPEEFHTAATKGEERLKIEYLDKATTREFSAYAKAKGYDGVVFNNIYDSGMDGEEVQSTVVIAFDSNQVKTVGNTNPTTDRDIRYSTVNETLKQNEERTAARHQTIQELTRDLEKIKADRDFWKGQTKVTKHYTLDGKATDQYTKEVLKDWSATIDPETVSKEIKRLGEYVKDTKNPDYDNWFGEISTLAYSIIESAEELANAESYQKYKEIKEYFRGKTINVQKGDIADFNAYRKSLFGTLNLSTTSGIGIDTIWSELQEEFGRDLFPDDIINNTEMVQHVVAVLDSLNAIYENPFNYEMQEATEELAAKLAADLFDGVIRQADPTYADRMEAKIKAIREEYQQMLTDTGVNEKIQKVKDKAKEHEKKAVRKERNRILEREKAKRERLEANLKQSVKESKQRVRERKADSKMRSDLLRIAKRLNNKKLPKVNRELLNQYIGELDLISKGMRADTQLRLENLRDEYKALQEADPLYSDQHIEDAIDRLNKKHINELTQEEVAELTEVLLSFEKEMREANQIKIHNETVDLHIAAEEAATKIRQQKGVKENLYGLNDMFLTRALSPMRFFKRIVGYDTTNPLYKVAEDLNAAERTKLQYELNANKLLREFTEDKKFMKSIRGKNAQEITLKGFWDGKIKEVKITPDMRISIYLLSRQEEALKHMEEGGLTIPDIKKYKDNKGSDAYNVRDLNSNRIRLSHQDVLRCIEGMSEKEKAFANAISKYYNEVSQPTISEVYENLMGYAMKAVDHYFPVNSDGDFLNKEVGFDESLTIGDPGWLKERKKSGNPIYLYDASQVVTKSISQHSKYIAFAEVTKQMDKLLKTQIGSVDETGNYNGYQDTILKAIRSRFGKQGEEYIPRLMKDIKGMATDSDAFGDVLAKIRTNYAGAVLTLNLGVAMKQAASIPTAIAVLGYKAVFNPSNVAAFKNEKLNDIIDKYTPYHWTRRQGYSTQELGDIKNLTSSKYAITDWIRGKNLPKGLNWIQFVDVGTTRFLWKASANYVRDNTNLEVGSDAFYKEVAKVYEQVITETQPNYTTMQRPDYLRSKDQLTRSMFMFKTQPFQNFNLLVDSVGEYNALKRAARLDESLKPKLQEAQKRLVTTITSQTLAAFTFAMLTMAYALMRGKKKDYEDDKGNFAPMGRLLNGTLGSFAGGFVGGTELYNLISSKITGEKYYGISEVSTSSLASLIDAISTSYDIASDLLTGEKSLSDVRYSMNKLVSTASKTLGVPYDNVNNILMMAYRPALKAAYGEYVGEYYMMVMTINPNSTYYRSQYYDLLYKAYKNDKNAYARLKKMFMEETGVKESTIDKKMKDLDKK